MQLKKLFFVFGFLFLLSGSSKAQQFIESWEGVPNLERHQVTFNFLGPGIRYELGLFKNLSISNGIAPALAFYQEGYLFGFAWHTRIRYYHNFKKRYNMAMKVTGNSANYFGPARSLFWEPLQISNNLEAQEGFSFAFYGGVYGFQRTNEKGFNSNIEFGFGYYDGFGVASGYGALINLTFGWVPTNRKSGKTIKVN